VALSGVENLARLPELKKRLLWTLLLLFVYRIGIHIPVPGVNGPALASIFEEAAGTLLGLFNMFSGGGLQNLSIFALGIMPYISASIILQLLTVVSPELKRLQKEEGQAGRKKITQLRHRADFPGAGAWHCRGTGKHGQPHRPGGFSGNRRLVFPDYYRGHHGHGYGFPDVAR
jgi:hypothetical protein